MGQLDNALRSQAIPFFGQIAGYNRSDQSDLDITQCTAAGDMAYLFNTGSPYIPQKNNLIRILNPQFLTITAAYLTMSLTTANNEPLPQFYVTVGTGYTTAQGLVPAVPTDADILRIHTLIKGDSNPYTTPNGAAGTITINKANLLALLPKYGSANYRNDCFVLGIHFPQQPSASTGWKVNKLEVQMAGVITNGN